MGNESGTWIMYGVSREDRNVSIQSMKQWNISIRWDFCRFLKMRFRGFHWKSALLRNIGGAAIPKAIPGNGVRSLPEAVKSPMENFFDKKAGFISKQWFPYFCKL